MTAPAPKKLPSKSGRSVMHETKQAERARRVEAAYLAELVKATNRKPSGRP